MKTIFLFLLISLNMSAQYLSQSKEYISTVLKNQKVDFTYEEDKYILLNNVSGCICLFEFDKNGICIKETITALSNPTVVSLIMGLNEKNYVKLGNNYYHEETYGLVEVNIKNNTFIFTYE